MGLLTQNDAKIFRSWFKEMCKLRGLPIKYRYIIENPQTTIYNEVKPKFSDYIDMDVIYIDNPKIKTLRNIGWVSENKDDKPYIVLMPFDTEQLSTKCRIYIPQIESVNNEEFKEFEITSIQTTIEFPDCYTCTIAPVFKSNEEKPDYSQSNYNYIRVDQNDRLM